MNLRLTVQNYVCCTLREIVCYCMRSCEWQQQQQRQCEHRWKKTALETNCPWSISLCYTAELCTSASHCVIKSVLERNVAVKTAFSSNTIFFLRLLCECVFFCFCFGFFSFVVFELLHREDTKTCA